MRDALAEDPVVGSLLLIHGLHPVPLEERVRGGARRACGPYMESHGGDVELVGSRTASRTCGCVGSCNGCPSSASTLELADQGGAREARARPRRHRGRGRRRPARARRMSGCCRSPATARGQPTWAELAGVAARSRSARCHGQVGGVALLVANVGGTLLAYRNACAGCGAPLHGGELDGGVLACPACGRRFELPLAGRALGGDAAARARAAARGRAARAGWRSCSIDGRRSGSSRRLGESPSSTSRRPGRRRRRERALRPLRRRRSRPTTATCCTSRSGGSSAPARRAARCSPATRRTGRRAPRTVWLAGARPPRRALGAFRDPDRAGLLLREQPGGRRRRLLPEPRRGDRVRARPRAPGSELVAANPVLDDARARRRGADRQPPGRCAPLRDRRRSTSATGSSAWSGSLGGHLGRPDARAARSPASSTSCSEGALVTERRQLDEHARRARARELEVLDAAPRPTRRLRRCLHASRAPSRRRARSTRSR